MATASLLVRGSINMDEFFELPHIVRSGETISSTKYSRRAGGKGANEAVAAAKAGAMVDFSGAIGKDGLWLRETLAAYGVGISRLGTDDEVPTGRAIIQLSTSTADNSIVLFPGSNFSLSSSPFASATELSSAGYTHILLQNEIPLDETISALRTAKKAGMATIFNPSPMLSKEQLEAFPWTELDWLIINEGEGEDLAAALSPSSAASAEGGSPSSAEGLLKQLRKTVLSELTGIIMTRGADGVCASLRGSEQVVAVGAGKVEGKIVDTTGAGDCFTGYFATLLAALSSSSSSSSTTLTSPKLSQILAIACQAAAMCCEKNGAMESVPTLGEVKARMGSDWAEGAEWERLLSA